MGSKIQLILANRTSQIMKHEQDVIIHKGSGNRCSGYIKHALPHA